MAEELARLAAERAPVIEPAKPKAKSETEVRYGYHQGLNHFRATYRDKADRPGDELGLVMERRGLFTWKLVKIELPPNLGR